MSARPQLHLVDTATGELVEDSYAYQLDELQKKYLGLLGENGRLKKQLAGMRLVEPEAQVILDILEYWRTLCSPTAVLAPGGKRWEKTRARLMEKLIGRDPFTPKELKLAIDGALLDPWINGTARGSKGYLDPQTIFRDAEQVSKLRDLAIGFEAKAGVALSDLVEAANELRIVSWKHVLRKCECEHRRIEHRFGDPEKEGKESCLLCPCADFYEDPFERVGKQYA